MEFETPHTLAPTNEVCLTGTPIRRGLVVGIARFDTVIASPTNRDPLPPDRAESEVQRLQDAILTVQRHLTDHVRQLHIPNNADLDQIVAAHHLILEDHHFIEGINERIRTEQVFAERAVEEAFRAAADRLSTTRDSYLRARAEDIRDVCQAIRTALIRGSLEPASTTSTGPDTIFVSPHLHVSSVLRAQRAGAVAFVTESHAVTSHAGLLLRASGIPSLAGITLPAGFVQAGTPLLVDADHGELVINPSQSTRSRLQRRRPTGPVVSQPVPPEPATCADGTAIELWGNIDTPDDMDLCHTHALHGVGLFRTEFMMLARGEAPREEEQYNVYRKTVEALRGRPVVLRTFDIGAEKTAPGLENAGGTNPALGLRGLRRHLVHCPEEFRTQLRAILRATHDSDAGVLLPMVTHLDDLRAAKAHLLAVRAELESAEVPYNPKLKIGIMIEVPAAALNLDTLLPEADFATVGTNDLAQYLAAADRNNADLHAYLAPEVSGLFTLLKLVAAQARAQNRLQEIYIAGALPTDPEHARRLAGLGFQKLIVDPELSTVLRTALASARATQA